jgi:hypothetical protein
VVEMVVSHGVLQKQKGRIVVMHGYQGVVRVVWSQEWELVVMVRIRFRWWVCRIVNVVMRHSLCESDGLIG